MELLMDYQIPSDLLSYNGEEDVIFSSKVDYVKSKVMEMQEMLHAAKEKEVEEAKIQYEYEPQISVVEDSIPIGDELCCYDSFCDCGCCCDCECERECCCCKCCRCCDCDCDDEDDAPPPPKPQAKAKAAAPAPAPKPKSEEPAPPQEQKQTPPKSEEKKEAGKPETSEVQVDEVDITQVPARLDELFGEFDVDNALRPTIITTGGSWTKTSQKSLLSSPVEETLYGAEQDKLRDKAFDLLDALSRSGGLAFDEASFHVIVAVTHCFDQTLMDTLVQQNVNPIDRVERSSLLISSTTHDLPVKELVKEDQKQRVTVMFPELLQLGK
jgi:hypothetical protein